MTDAAEQQQGEPLSLPKDQLQQQQEKHDSGVLAVDDSNVAKDDEGVSQTAAASEDDTLAKQQRDGGAAATATAPAPALHRPLTETSPLAMPARLDDRVSPEGTHESTLQLPSALPQQQQQSETPSKQQRVSPTNASLSPQRASPSNNEPVRRSPLGQTVVTHEDLGAGGEAVVEGRKRTRSAGANDENVDAAAPPPRTLSRLVSLTLFLNLFLTNSGRDNTQGRRSPTGQAAGLLGRGHDAPTAAVAVAGRRERAREGPRDGRGRALERV